MSAAILEFPLENPRRKVERKIPDFLVRESFFGKKFYYPGYRNILNKTKTLEDAMADSTLQWTLKEHIGDRLKAGLDLEKYRVGRGEVGVHLGPGENVGLDVAVFERSKLASNQIGGKYAQVAPVLAVEIDISVEAGDKSTNIFEDYAMNKIERLLQFGTSRFLWIFTKSRRVFIAEPGTHWHFVPWNQDVELMHGIRFNVAAILEQEQIDLHQI